MTGLILSTIISLCGEGIEDRNSLRIVASVGQIRVN